MFEMVNHNKASSESLQIVMCVQTFFILFQKMVKINMEIVQKHQFWKGNEIFHVWLFLSLALFGDSTISA